MTESFDPAPYLAADDRALISLLARRVAMAPGEYVAEIVRRAIEEQERRVRLAVGLDGLPTPPTAADG